ncbi:hypothetical protein HH308_21135 [Gordonia sp. TBRC 11910]|uniref:Uncharacterized protein n=1 Tax=Gordonia asplenii TaxID=2725283 RepID=A0A848L3U4_9ACTN|nr:hypothetical protein [Gordonia asplenii]NMO03725.1 hypothetical protein [Gordonia asplenii]
MSPLDDVLLSAARLQELVPDAVLVGGNAAALHAHHRDSFDHDHVVRDLEHRFGAILDALESDPDWVVNRATPGKIILGELGGIEAGVRQMIRTVPLEVEEVQLTNGATVRVPGPDSVASQVMRQLSAPRPRDSRTTAQLTSYKGLRAPWTDWSHVADQCRAIADKM